MIKYGTNNIGKIYFGSNLIGKAYFGSNLVYSSGSGPQPTGIAYVRGGANGSYIDTGITPDSTTKVIVWARNFNPATDGYTWLFGSRIANQNAMYAVALPNGNRTGEMRIAYAATNTDLADKWTLMSGYHKYELRGPDLYVDDELVGNGTAGTISTSYNIFLFGLNNAGTFAGCNSPIDICACQIYKNNVLVRDFTAVNSPSVGMYDAVSNTLFTNAGSGSFTYGTFNQNAYTPLEYIVCSGEQYFDTGLYGSQSTKIITKFRPTGTTKTYYRLFGCRNSAETNDIMLELMIGNTSYANRYYDTRYKASTNTVYNSASQTNSDLVYVHDANVFTLYKNNSQLGTKTATAATFTTPYTMYIGTSSMSGGGGSYKFYGYIYHFGFGGEKNFVPAKVNDVAGMYDTYNDVFYPSAETAFVAGPEL